MIKHRRLSKKAAAAVLAAAILIGTSTTAFAYVNPGAEQTVQEQTTETAPDDSGKEAVSDERTSEGDTVLEETDETGTAFSTPGNAQVQDDITEDSTKEFLTITTKNNNTFYLVIDRSASTENVYMLSQIDESDLQEFLDSGAVISEETSAPSVVLEENDTSSVTPENEEELASEEEQENVSAGNLAGVLAILLLAGAGAGAYYYFKIRKKKAEAEEENSEGLEFSDGLETVDEREEDEDNYE